MLVCLRPSFVLLCLLLRLLSLMSMTTGCVSSVVFVFYWSKSKRYTLEEMDCVQRTCKNITLYVKTMIAKENRTYVLSRLIMEHRYHKTRRGKTRFTERI